MTAEASALGALIDDAEVDWLKDALHAVVGICSHHPGSLTNQVIEALFYELAPTDEPTGTAFDDDHHRGLIIDDQMGIR